MLASWRERYWLGGMALGILLCVSLIMNDWLPAAKRVDQRAMGLDFVAFYTAGTFARQGHAGNLYDLNSIREFQRELAAKNDLDLQNTAGWWNPPIYALVFAPLSGLSFRASYWVWLAINAGCIGLAIWVLCKLLPRQCAWDYRALVALLICVSMPTIQTIGHAQNSGISLLILSAAVTLALAERPMAAGVVCGLLLYKPQIAGAAAIVLALATHWRVLVGFALMTSMTLLANCLFMPGTLHAYITGLGANLHAIQFGQTYIWERQATLAGFWRLLIQGREAGEKSQLVLALTWISQIVLAGGLLRAWWRERENSEKEGSTTFMIAGLTAMPLLLPYFLDYDLLLLAVPAVLYARKNLSQADRIGVILWTTLYLCLLINPGLGRLTHLNVAVVILSILSGRMIWECVGRRAELEAMFSPVATQRVWERPVALQRG